MKGPVSYGCICQRKRVFLRRFLLWKSLCLYVLRRRKMIYETISIQMEGTQPEGASLQVYALDSADSFQKGLVRPMILICPGGGYAHVSEREAEPIAMRLLAMGYHAAILKYSIAPAARFPTALLELAQAMKTVREHAGKWHVDTEKIFVMGFSAGGHLAASLGAFWTRKMVYEPVGMKPEQLRPAGLILCYPVICSEENYTHGGSFKNLLGERFEELKEELSIEKQAKEQMPPCFIWHTYTDGSVPVENSLLLFAALRKANVSAEMHIYPEGQHGLALGDDSTSPKDGSMVCECVQSWIDLLGIWLKGRM